MRQRGHEDSDHEVLRGYREDLCIHCGRGGKPWEDFEQ